MIGGGVWGKSIVFNKKIGFNGKIFAVHPSENMFCGCETYGNIDELPVQIVLLLLGLTEVATIDIISQLSKANCGGAVCFASGFSNCK